MVATESKPGHAPNPTPDDSPFDRSAAMAKKPVISRINDIYYI
jgi:hypothetical protein